MNKRWFVTNVATLSSFRPPPCQMECNSSSPLLPPLLGSLSPQERGALVVVTDMSLAVLSVVMNLVVLTAIR